MEPTRPGSRDTRPASPVSSFVVRVRRDGAGGGVVERVRDGLQEPFGTLAEVGPLIARLLEGPPRLDR